MIYLSVRTFGQANGCDHCLGGFGKGALWECAALRPIPDRNAKCAVSHLTPSNRCYGLNWADLHSGLEAVAPISTRECLGVLGRNQDK